MAEENGPLADRHEARSRPQQGGSAAVPSAPPAARRQALHQVVLQRRFVTVTDIAREVGISEMTVRRDLKTLERDGKVQRSHGGAVPVEPLEVRVEPSFAARRGLHAAAKRAIARAAAALVGPHEVVGLDVGSTVATLAAELRDCVGLSIVTNSIQVVLALSGQVQADVYVLGGRLRPREGSLCGRIARHQMREHWLHKVFIGVAGIDTDGVFDYSVDEADVKAAYMERATEVVVLCDASKFNHRSFVKVCGFASIGTLVTDLPPPAALGAEFARHKVRVIVANDAELYLPAVGGGSGGL
jgi:DeoR family glycerol-3-phosphate regulon repressor